MRCSREFLMRHPFSPNNQDLVIQWRVIWDTERGGVNNFRVVVNLFSSSQITIVFILALSQAYISFDLICKSAETDYHFEIDLFIVITHHNDDAHSRKKITQITPFETTCWKCSQTENSRRKIFFCTLRGTKHNRKESSTFSRLFQSWKPVVTRKNELIHFCGFEARGCNKWKGRDKLNNSLGKTSHPSSTVSTPQVHLVKKAVNIFAKCSRQASLVGTWGLMFPVKLQQCNAAAHLPRSWWGHYITGSGGPETSEQHLVYTTLLCKLHPRKLVPSHASPLWMQTYNKIFFSEFQIQPILRTSCWEIWWKDTTGMPGPLSMCWNP